MSRINQSLLDRLSVKLGVGKPRVYELIQQVSARNRVPRHLGALLLAGDNGISIQKYASQKDLADLGGMPQRAPAAILNPADAPLRAVRQNVKSAKVSKKKENTVFVVHGRDEGLRDSMYSFLGALGLRPQEWSHAIRAASRGKGGNPYINEAVTKIMEQAQAIVVIISPDDEVKLRDHFVRPHERSLEGRIHFQARPNVLFETGIAIGTHQRKSIVVQVGQVKSFTDISGMHIVHLSNTDRSRNEFANRLEAVGCKVDKTGGHWLSAGSFEPYSVTKRKKRTVKPTLRRRRSAKR